MKTTVVTGTSEEKNKKKGHIRQTTRELFIYEHLKIKIV